MGTINSVCRYKNCSVLVLNEELVVKMSYNCNSFILGTLCASFSYYTMLLHILYNPLYYYIEVIHDITCLLCYFQCDFCTGPKCKHCAYVCAYSAT